MSGRGRGNDLELAVVAKRGTKIGPNDGRWDYEDAQQ